MKQPKKLKKRPDLKKRLDTVRSAPEPDITFTVTLPADVYHTIELAAEGQVGAWVADMLVEAAETGFLEAALDEPPDGSP